MLQDLQVGIAGRIIAVEPGPGEIDIARLVDEDRSPAQAQIGGVKWQNNLGGGAARTGKQFMLAGSQGVLDQQRLVKLGIAENGLAA
jgi:hypothetical protein